MKTVTVADPQSVIFHFQVGNSVKRFGHLLTTARTVVTSNDGSFYTDLSTMLFSKYFVHRHLNNA